MLTDPKMQMERRKLQQGEGAIKKVWLACWISCYSYCRIIVIIIVKKIRRLLTL